MKAYSVLRTLWHHLLDLIGLNLLFCLLCLPLVTAPAAFTALSCACRRCLEDKGNLFGSYFRCFKRTLISALPYGLSAAVGVGGFLYGAMFYRRLASDAFLFLPLSVFCLIAAYLISAAMGVVFQLLALEGTKFRQPLKQAAELLLKNPRVLLTWLLLGWAVAVMGILLLPHSLPVGLLLGAALPALFAARAVLSIIDTEDQP